MSIDQIYIQLDELRVAIGRFAPDDPQRKRALRQFFPLVGAIAQQEQDADSQINLLNRRLEILIDQAKKLDTDQPLEEEQLQLLRREILSYAMGEIQKSGKLWKNTEVKYADAYNQTWLKILEFFYRNYQRYDPTKGATVITWLSHRFDWEFRDQQKKVWKVQNNEISNSSSVEDESLELIDMMKDKGEMPSDGCSANLMKKQIKNWIETDPILQKTHIRNRPDITAQILLKERFIEDVKWRILSQELQVGIPTLSGFYKTQCKPKLITFVENNCNFD